MWRKRTFESACFRRDLLDEDSTILGAQHLRCDDWRSRIRRVVLQALTERIHSRFVALQLFSTEFVVPDTGIASLGFMRRAGARPVQLVAATACMRIEK